MVKKWGIWNRAAKVCAHVCVYVCACIYVCVCVCVCVCVWCVCVWCGVCVCLVCTLEGQEQGKTVLFLITVRRWATYPHTALFGTFLLTGLGAVVELGASLLLEQ